MNKSLALLSGKGGSGKTTLALSIASMLSDCGIRVLLVDCDLSTNGATYFYESKLSVVAEKTTSFYDVLYNRKCDNYNFVKINKWLDFLPSLVQISEETTNSYSYGESDQSGWHRFYKQVYSMYDVILFDCQAGYTDMLKVILPTIDINLFVMEADAISSSAIRSLYLKIGDIIKDKKTYQIFNKATEDEYEVYSKLSGGTVFTNIETIIFDWKIRKAFSIAQIPDMANTSARYGKQIYNICQILFRNAKIQKLLHLYEIVVQHNEKTAEVQLIEEKIEALRAESRVKSTSMQKFFPALALLAMSLSLFLIYWTIDKNSISNEVYMILGASLCAILTIVAYIEILAITKDKREHYKVLNTYKETLNTAMMECADLEKILLNYTPPSDYKP